MNSSHITTRTLVRLFICLLITTGVDAAQTVASSHIDRVLESSLELERRTQPWCPDDCSVLIPFVAEYRKGTEHLVFVGTRHAFNPKDKTMRAVDAGFASLRPKVIIIEGFPTKMGESPKQLIEVARSNGTPDADEYARSELGYAVSLAVKRRIPFLGGEQTRSEEIDAARASGFTDDQIAFTAMAGWYSQMLRSGDMPDTSINSLSKHYPQVRQLLKTPIENGGMNMDALSLDEFRAQYRNLYGIDIEVDTEFPLRIDTTNNPSDQAKEAGLNRDRHLLSVIEQQLAGRHSVLVVYGGSHWSTLSEALEARLGRPTMRPFE